MGYRNTWLNHAGAVTVHSEATLHAFDRSIAIRPMSMLIVGIGNGGAVEVWRDTLPEGSKVAAMDSDSRCAALPGIDTIICDVTQREDVRAALKGEWFDAVIDTTNTMQPYVWPFLRAGGVYIYEGYNPEMVMMLSRDLALGDDSWLPTEEIMQISQYFSCVVIEKRTPLVVPYMEILAGNFCDVVPEKEYQERGAKRVIPA